MKDQEHSSPAIDRTEVRVALVRAGVLMHEFAARVRIHPVYMSAVLTGRKPLSPALAARIRAALKTLDQPKA